MSIMWKTCLKLLLSFSVINFLAKEFNVVLCLQNKSHNVDQIDNEKEYDDEDNDGDDNVDGFDLLAVLTKNQ